MEAMFSGRSQDGTGASRDPGCARAEGLPGGPEVDAT